MLYVMMNLTLTATAGGIAGATYQFTINDAIVQTITAGVTQTS